MHNKEEHCSTHSECLLSLGEALYLVGSDSSALSLCSETSYFFIHEV